MHITYRFDTNEGASRFRDSLVKAFSQIGHGVPKIDDKRISWNEVRVEFLTNTEMSYIDQLELMSRLAEKDCGYITGR